MDWFEELMGFAECGYAQTQQRLAVNGDWLYSTVNGKSWAIGHLETPTLAELRDRARAAVPTHGRLRVSAIASDAKQLHVKASSQGALFQVASQFNLLEMMHYSVSPEEGVARYEYDPTQGPACAVAAGQPRSTAITLRPFPANAGKPASIRSIPWLMCQQPWGKGW